MQLTSCNMDGEMASQHIHAWHVYTVFFSTVWRNLCSLQSIYLYLPLSSLYSPINVVLYQHLSPPEIYFFEGMAMDPNSLGTFRNCLSSKEQFLLDFIVSREIGWPGLSPHYALCTIRELVVQPHGVGEMYMCCEVTHPRCSTVLDFPDTSLGEMWIESGFPFLVSSVSLPHFTYATQEDLVLC